MRINKMFRGVFATAVLLAMTGTPAIAQSLIVGTVKDAKDQPVDAAIVLFESTSSSSKRDVKTNKKGEFLFQGLTSGDYKVTASKDGVGTESQLTTVSQTKMTMNFVLRPARPSAASTAAAAAAAGLEALSAAPAEAARDKELADTRTLAASAMESVKAERHEEAVTKLTDLVARLPTCADCYMHLGNSYFRLQKFDEAETALKKSVEISPTVEGYTALTRFYNTQKKFDLAGDASQKAADLAAAPVPVAATPAGAAAGATAAAAAPAPSGAGSETLYNQGVVLWNQGKFAEAKTQFEASVKANPSNADAQYQLGMANLNLGQLPQARAAFDAYLQAAPDGPKAAEVKGFLAQLPK